MSLTSPWIAAFLALFVWWFSTGAILAAVRWADGRGRGAGLWLTVASLPIFGLGCLGILASLSSFNAVSAYTGFLSAIALWGWIELAFLTGVITGPNQSAFEEDRPRFAQAWRTVAYHEVFLTLTLGFVVYATFGADNKVGLWTFVILYFARVSAKLNLYFGVPRINVEFIPESLAHIPSHFRTAPLNWLFPISITALSLATFCWIERLYSALALTYEAGVVGFALLTTITALASLEHWFMVLPMADAKLWRWMLPDRKAQASAAPKTPQDILGREDAHGL